MVIVEKSVEECGVSPSVSGMELSDGGSEVGSESTSSDSNCFEEESEVDSGMESDEYGCSEVGEAGSELCRVGEWSCMVPYELYDLLDLTSVLSVEVWDDCLTEEERLSLSRYLPDMDQESFVRTMRELLSGGNLHFGSPVIKFFDMLKGGLCDLKVVDYREGLNFIKKREYYNHMRRYQNSMVVGFVSAKNAWKRFASHEIKERIRFLNMLRKQMYLRHKGNGRVSSEIDSEDKEADEVHWRKRLKREQHDMSSNKPLGVLPPWCNFEKETSKRMSNVSTPKSLMKSYMHHHAPGIKSRLQSSPVEFHHKGSEHESGRRSKTNIENYDDDMDVDGQVNATGMHHRIRMKHGKKNSSQRQMATAANYGSNSYKKSRHLESVWDDSWQGEWVNDQSGLGHSKQGDFYREFSPVEDPGKGLFTKSTKSKKLEMGGERKSKTQKRESPDIRNHSSKMHGMAALQHPRDWNSYDLDETESGSSDHMEEEAETMALPSKIVYPNQTSENHQFATGRSSKSSAKKIRAEYAQPYVESLDCWRSNRALHPFSGLPHSELILNNRQAYKMISKNQMQGNSHVGSQLPYNIEKSERFNPGYLVSQSKQMLDYANNGLMEDVGLSPEIMNGISHANSPVSRQQFMEAHANDHDEYLKKPLLGCISGTKKPKSKAECKISDGQAKHELTDVKKKGKRKQDFAKGSISLVNHAKLVPDKETIEVEPEAKPARKPFTLITPTVHTGFSFSVVHLLSAVRRAMITVSSDEANGVQNLSKEVNGASVAYPTENLNSTAAQQQKNLPSLTIQEIVNRVRCNPGDPCILETQEPLQDLVRGVLKIFSSKAAPLGAKGWKALVLYEKSTKSWCWTGPVSPISADPVEEETSAEAWGIPYKMLVKLVDAFANWLKSGQETLKKIGSLPPPPPMPMPNLDEKERFRDLRAQKSLSTITPSSEEVKAYFRLEEFLRYQVPDRAFSYTAADGKKSIVAPLRRGGGKPTSKARDHFMLKQDRPPHVTILCLVRDAAARLPGSIGTRADVCTLIRDSQYTVEDVSDTQVNQVVSGALDRLHYERDPCVQYDNDRKLWVYLHREREEEDFEDDGTSSTKKWKKPRKDAAASPDVVASANGNCHENENQVENGSARLDPSVLNMNMSSTNAVNKPELLFGDLKPNTENQGTPTNPVQGGPHENPMVWEVMGSHQLRKNEVLCQENSTNEDFDNEIFGRERTVGLLKTNLL